MRETGGGKDREGRRNGETERKKKIRCLGREKKGRGKKRKARGE